MKAHDQPERSPCIFLHLDGSVKRISCIEAQYDLTYRHLRDSFVDLLREKAD